MCECIIGVLSPRLFNNYLSDISDYLDSELGIDINGTMVGYLLYADDLVLFSATPQGLQSQLDNLFQYCRKWHLIVNMSESNVMVFHEKKESTTTIFNYGKEPLDRVTAYKYLGFTLLSDRKDIFHSTYKELADKGRKAVYDAYSSCSVHIGRPKPRTALKLFDSQVRPCIDYGCEIWGLNKGREIDKLETIHLRYLKSMLGVRKQTTSAAVYADTGRVPLRAHWEVQTIKYWERISNLPNSHILKKCYLSLYNLDVADQVNWCSNVKSLLGSLGGTYSELWDTQRTLNNPKTIGVLTEAIYGKYKDVIMGEINEARGAKKLRTYRTFKSEFCLEHYLFNVNNCKYRYALAQFRLSSHNLGIETGRHCKPPKPANERICLYCQSGSVDDEVHFLTKCSFHDEYRKVFENTVKSKMSNYPDMSNIEKFENVMKTSDDAIINALAKYVYVAFKQRKQV